MLVAVAVYMYHDYGTVAAADAAAVLAAIVAISTTVMALYGFDKETIAGDADDDTSTVAFHNAVMCLTQNRLLQHLASCMSPM